MSEIVKRVFDKRAEKFLQIYEKPNLIDRIFRKSVLARFRKALEECSRANYKSALDIGCGSGLLALKLAQVGMDVTGIDFSSEMINMAAQVRAGKDVKGKLDFTCVNLMDFNPQQKFDVVIALGVFDYISQPQAYLEKMMSLAIKEIIVSFPAAGDIWSIQRKARYCLFKRCPVYFYKKRQIEGLCIQSGLSNFKLKRLHRDYFLQEYLK